MRFLRGLFLILVVGAVAYLFYDGYFFCPGSIYPTATTQLIIIDIILVGYWVNPPEPFTKVEFWKTFSVGLFLCIILFFIIPRIFFPALGNWIDLAQQSCLRAGLW